MVDFRHECRSFFSWQLQSLGIFCATHCGWPCNLRAARPRSCGCTIICANTAKAERVRLLQGQRITRKRVISPRTLSERPQPAEPRCAAPGRSSTAPLIWARSREASPTSALAAEFRARRSYFMESFAGQISRFAIPTLRLRNLSGPQQQATGEHIPLAAFGVPS